MSYYKNVDRPMVIDTKRNRAIQELRDNLTSAGIGGGVRNTTGSVPYSSPELQDTIYDFHLINSNEESKYYGSPRKSSRPYMSLLTGSPIGVPDLSNSNSSGPSPPHPSLHSLCENLDSLGENDSVILFPEMAYQIVSKGKCITKDTHVEYFPEEHNAIIVLNANELDTIKITEMSYFSLIRDTRYKFYVALLSKKPDIYTLVPLNEKQITLFRMGNLKGEDILKELENPKQRLSEGAFGVTYLNKNEDIVHKKFKNWEKEKYPSGDVILEVGIYKVLGSIAGCLPTLLHVDYDDHKMYITAAKSDLYRSHFIETPEKESFGRNIFLDLFHCLRLTHQQGIIHRDIKPQNLVSVDPDFRRSGNYSLGQLIDFGLAIYDRTKETNMLKSNNVYTLWYRPLEVLLDKNYGFPADIYAMGVSMIECFFDNHFLPGDDEGNQIELIVHMCGGNYKNEKTAYELLVVKSRSKNIEARIRKKYNVPVGKHDNLINLCGKLLEPNPNNRPSYDEIFAHPFFSDNIMGLMWGGEIPGRELPAFNRYEMTDVIVPPIDTFESATDMNNTMRRIIADWLFEVCLQFDFDMDVYLLTLLYVDYYVSKLPNTLRKNLQGIGCASLYVASSGLGHIPPDIRDLAYFSVNAYDRQTMSGFIDSLFKLLDGNIVNTSALTDYANKYNINLKLKRFLINNPDHSKVLKNILVLYTTSVPDYRSNVVYQQALGKSLSFADRINIEEYL